MYENRFLWKKIGENGKILLTYNRLIHHSNDNDKNVHPLNSPKLRMAKVRNGVNLKNKFWTKPPVVEKEILVFCQKG
jgi:hypothetical protein